MIIEHIEMEPFGSNCYIVGDEITKEGMIIDPGAPPEEILNKVEYLGLKIKLILLTHRHPDHTVALREIKAATKAEIAIHSEDKTLQSFRHFGLSNPLSQPLPTPDRLLSGGDSIDVGKLHFLVIHTPAFTGGYLSPGGGCCFYRRYAV